MPSAEKKEAFDTKGYGMFSGQSVPSYETSEYAIDFEREDIDELEKIYKAAHVDIHYIVKHLKDKDLLKDGAYRSSFFIGVQGSGKSTIAKAIAYKMHQKKEWKNQFIVSSDFFQRYRNQTAISLREILNKINQSSTPQILIIDELNRLLDHAESKEHDSDSTSTTLWTFLDKQNNRHHFFFIGIMNSAENLPIQVKDRMGGKMIYFDYITDKNIKIQMFKNILNNKNKELHHNIDDNYLDQQLSKLPTCSARNIANLILDITKIFFRERPKKGSIIFQKRHIEEAINVYLYLQEKNKYYKITETSEERQERHHKENKQMNKEQIQEQKRMHQESVTMQQKHFTEQQTTQKDIYKKQKKEQKKLHKENIEMQEVHFVQQQKIQMTLIEDQYVTSGNISAGVGIGGGGSYQQANLTQNGKNTIDAILTNQQKQLYQQATNNNPQSNYQTYFSQFWPLVSSYVSGYWNSGSQQNSTINNATQQPTQTSTTPTATQQSNTQAHQAPRRKYFGWLF